MKQTLRPHLRGLWAIVATSLVPASIALGQTQINNVRS